LVTARESEMETDEGSDSDWDSGWGSATGAELDAAKDEELASALDEVSESAPVFSQELVSV
jgi:hypothetical protein